MPNWTYNVLQVTGEGLDEFKNAVGDYIEKTELSFQKIKPRPPEEEKNWYEWNIENWGTKWDACDVHLEETGRKLTYSFDTAWVPPYPVIIEASRLFPNLTFMLSCEEESHEFPNFTAKIERGAVLWEK